MVWKQIISVSERFFLFCLIWFRQKFLSERKAASDVGVKSWLLYPAVRSSRKKTLVLDLDETLVHSVTIGSTLRSGHVVEVKLENQHAILYYVHKRPFCQWFLRQVTNYYTLVLFTASVQQYADPVINCIEEEQPVFLKRLYRQDCVNQGGTFIKDIGKLGLSLNEILIVDNSPTSYCLHQENAIPIEGWLNDPTDIDLLSLAPLLRAVSGMHDVRSFIVMRCGEKGYRD